MRNKLSQFASLVIASSTRGVLVPILALACFGIAPAFAAAPQNSQEGSNSSTKALNQDGSKPEKDELKSMVKAIEKDAAEQDQDEKKKSEEELRKRTQVMNNFTHFAPVPDNRWYQSPLPWALMAPPSFEINEPGDGFDPYRQNLLKGDFPIDGKDLFLRLTLTERLLLEFRDTPLPRGITGPSSNTSTFFGDGTQFMGSSKTALSIDLFKGQEAFKPVYWRVRLTPVVDFTHLDVEELAIVNINVGDGLDRTTGDIALQEAIFEYHLFDLNDRYDFVSSEIGILPFRSDFRGFIFDDIQLGARLFGNADENKWQYNVVFFDMLEKDTNSELNSFDSRDQQVFIANIYRQDAFVLGYNVSFSFHWNHDQKSTHFDVNDFLTRPQPIGFAKPKSLDAYYLGWTGEGHFGRINITHAFYQVFGSENNNALARRDTNINAQMAALELSYDFDWLRVRGYAMYASGDDDPNDGDAEGFDAIVDAALFAGGELSFWNRQRIGLLGVGLNGRGSFLNDLTTSKFEGQANFVNPGLMLVGAAVDAEILPEWRAQVGFNYLRFVHTEAVEAYLFLEDVNENIGWEVFMGSTYRPFLNNNVVLNVGASVFFPGDGFEKIYQSDETLYSIFIDLILTY